MNLEVVSWGKFPWKDLNLRRVIMEYSELKYNEIKSLVDNIEFSLREEDEIKIIIEKLHNDKRKNVIALGHRLEKKLKDFIKENNRVKALYDNDRAYGDNFIIAGVDEVGRGPLAGPIVAAAVILDLNCQDSDLLLGIDDSKALTEERREKLDKLIRKKALGYSISICSNDEIDRYGIAYCNNKVFKDSVYNLKKVPDMVLSDGYLIKDFNLPNKYLIKGDKKSASIACASIIAKVYRDKIMKEYAKEYTYYDFENNVGYGTKKHMDGIKNYGTCKIHRKTFLNNIL